MTKTTATAHELILRDSKWRSGSSVAVALPLWSEVLKALSEVGK